MDTSTSEKASTGDEQAKGSSTPSPKPPTPESENGSLFRVRTSQEFSMENLKKRENFLRERLGRFGESSDESSKQPNQDGEKRPATPLPSKEDTLLENEPKCGYCLKQETECYGPAPCSRCVEVGYTAEQCVEGPVHEDDIGEERLVSSGGVYVGDEKRQNRFDRFDRP